MGKIVSIIIGFITTVFLGILFFYTIQHNQIKSSINELNYNIVDTVTSLGILNEHLYDHILFEANKYSRGTVDYNDTEIISDNRYTIQIKLDKQIKPGIYDTFIISSDYIESARSKYNINNIAELNSVLKANNEKEIGVINVPLGIGDKITIFLEDRTNTIFGQIINMPFFNYLPDKYIDSRIKSVKSGIVANNPDNITVGYDVIANIKKYSGVSQVAISVQTKLSDTPRYYGDASHPALKNVQASTRLDYGNEADEKGDINTSTNQGKYFIFGNGIFKVNEVWENDYRLIEYIQQ